MRPSAAEEQLKEVLLPISKAFFSSLLYDSDVLSAMPDVACNLLIALVKSVPALVAAVPAAITGKVTPVVID